MGLDNALPWPGLLTPGWGQEGGRCVAAAWGAVGSLDAGFQSPTSPPSLPSPKPSCDASFPVNLAPHLLHLCPALQCQIARSPSISISITTLLGTSHGCHFPEAGGLVWGNNSPSWFSERPTQRALSTKPSCPCVAAEPPPVPSSLCPPPTCLFHLLHRQLQPFTYLQAPNLFCLHSSPG